MQVEIVNELHPRAIRERLEEIDAALSSGELSTVQARLRYREVARSVSRFADGFVATGVKRTD